MTEEQFKALSDMQHARIEELEAQNARYEAIISKERDKKIHYALILGEVIHYVDLYGTQNGQAIAMTAEEVKKLIEILKKN